MDLPLRTRLLAAFVGVVVLMGALAILAGSFLINQMVIGEAERRVVLALRTAHSMLQRRLDEALKSCVIMAERDVAQQDISEQWRNPQRLKTLRAKCGYDFLHILNAKGTIMATAHGDNIGASALNSPVISKVLALEEPVAGISILPLDSIIGEADGRVEETRIRVLPTPFAKPGGPEELKEAMILEAAAPIMGGDKQFLGMVRVGTVLNKNFDFVDFVRENIFTMATYKGKNLGTVTLFQGDVRITTNVIGPDGKRAVGTRVSAEVRDQVLGEGKTWIGPAFVVDSWYLSAYEPLRDPDDKVFGMLYVGILKKRYDDMRSQAMNLFIGVTVLVFIGAVFISFWLAARLTRPLVQLTAGATEVSRGNLTYQLFQPRKAERDEIDRLTSAFNQMVSSLNERNEQIQRSRSDLQNTATELKQWIQNYLEALEFITHELKNQIAAMKINLLAVRDGYMGHISQEQKEALEDVSQAISRAEEMILNYLNLSRIEKGEMQVRARPLHLEVDVIQPVLSNLRSRLEAKGMRVEVRISEELLVHADPSLLRIVYENLVGNAAKYGKKGGLVRLSGKRCNGQAELHVWNDGPGVSADQTDRLFKRFSRLEQREGEEKERGTGLGLFITSEIVGRLGGDIHAESQYNEWMDFVFTLPLPDVLFGSETAKTRDQKRIV